jgi:putative transposase
MMARRRRHLSNQGVYHVYNRAELGTAIFANDAAKGLFLEALFRTVELHGWELFAYAIMTNHFHLLLSTPRGNLDVGMHALQSDFANKHKAFRGSIGHVFQSRYRADHCPAGPLAAARMDYVHLNPVRAGMTSLERLAEYPWTSYRSLRQPAYRGLLALGVGLETLHGLKDSPEGWLAYESRLRLTLMSDQRPPTEAELFGAVAARRRGALSEAQGPTLRTAKGRSELIAEERARWEAILDEILKAEGLTREEMGGRPASDAVKLAVALKVRQRCPAHSSWLAQRLAMGSASNVRRLIWAASPKGSGR